MAFPGGETLEVIIIFFVVILAICLFSLFYLRRYRYPHEVDIVSFTTSVVGLSIVLITSSLTPIDIFIASFMKAPDGTYKEWAVNVTQRNAIENGVLYSYYIYTDMSHYSALYGIIFVYMFLVIPFVYFFYEEKNDDGFDSENRCCNAVKFTVAFLVVATILLLVGAFVPLRASPHNNETDWNFIINDLNNTRGEDALSMVLSILCVVGMVNLVFYTGFGIFSFPIGLIRGTKSAKKEFEEIQDKHLVNQTRINTLRDKERMGSRLSSREQRQLSKLEEDERQIIREEQLVDEHRKTWRYKCRMILRPTEIAFGVIVGVLSLTVWISLLLTNVDKAMHSYGMKAGYFLPKRVLPNPIDIVLTFFQKVFPLDYVFVLIITWFLLLSTISGIRNLGVRLFFIKLYKLRVKKTRPQGLLLTCALLMLTVLAFNVFFYSLSPQYATYGSEHYVNLTAAASAGEDHSNVTIKKHTLPCPNEELADDCVMTRNAMLLTRYFYKAWFFGAFYYWSTWAFLGVSAISLLYLVIRKSRSVTYGLIDEDDLEESGDHPTRM